MNIIGYVLAAVFLCIFIFSAVFSLSKRTRKATLESTGNEIVSDYDDFGKSRIFLWKQRVRVYKSSADGEEFYILEKRSIRPWWIIRIPDISLIKIDQKGATKLIGLVNKTE